MRWVTLLLLFGAPALPLGAQTATTVNPHGANIGACSPCHAPDAWKPARISREFVHAPRTFPLEGSHQRTTCMACHRSLEFSAAPTACAQCHRDVHTGEMGAECQRCHTTRSFADQTNLRRMHELTRFALRGAHSAVDCVACHTPAQPGQRQYAGKPTACMGCHSGTYRAAKSPDHQAAGFPQDCTQCHTTTTWSGGKFNHEVTRFPLTGGHTAVRCEKCHTDGVFKGKTTVCSGCHQADYTWTKAPPHASSGFPTDCTMCHTVKAWNQAIFNHDQTAFALTGAHRSTTCARCHGDAVYKGKPTACASCHQTAYTATARPPHASLQFSTACASCHNTSTWAGAPFDHNTTSFALTGGHRTTPCASCHGDGVYRGKSSTCVSCHQANYAATKTPPHASGGFPTACQQCHTTASWIGAIFDHAATQFPLIGAHRAVACTACHGDNVFKGKPTACVSCHLANYTAAKTPPHAGFPTTCAICHTTISWIGGAFNHDGTQFPLSGAHRAAACTACHADNVYKGKSTACASCHLAKYTASTSPPHGTLNFSQFCGTCHNTTAWRPAPYDHSVTAFPLTGAHRTSPCASCHGDGVYRGKSTACASCHQTRYNLTVNPPHVTLTFSTACSQCHTTTAWAGGTFDHGVTRFALTGAHRAVACNGCHADGIYRGKSMLCASCHQGKYDAAVNPNHKSAAFPTTCEVCHSTTAWIPSSFSHAATRFPLTGAHVTAACAACHGDGVYRGKTTLCSGCHLARYNTTTNPNHKAASFPTTCESCHTTTKWLGATFNHDGSFFPIYSGKHKGRWTSCSDCHTVSTNYASFSCLSCHQKTPMDDKHKGFAGYRYDSAVCYGCHPRGTKP